MSLNQLLPSKSLGGLSLTCKTMTYEERKNPPTELPVAGQLKTYYKNDSNFYQIDSAGTESIVNGGSAGSVALLDFIPTLGIGGDGIGTFAVVDDPTRVCRYVVEDSNWVTVYYQFNYTKSGGSAAGYPIMRLPIGSPDITQSANPSFGLLSGFTAVGVGTLMATAHTTSLTIDFEEMEAAGGSSRITMADVAATGTIRATLRYWYGAIPSP